MHIDQNKNVYISLLGKILEEYVLPLKNIDTDLSFQNKPRHI